jgi:type II secretory pathway component GspD/PulD (secretin)
MGGLMKDSLEEDFTGFPILSRIPIISYFFRRDSDITKKIQTVIFIKATILDNESLNKDDNNFFNTTIGS